MFSIIIMSNANGPRMSMTMEESNVCTQISNNSVILINVMNLRTSIRINVIFLIRLRQKQIPNFKVASYKYQSKR